MRNLLIVSLLVGCALPVNAEETFLERHPLYAKVSAPVRAVAWRPLIKAIKLTRLNKAAAMVGDACKTAGNLSQPYHPFLNLVTVGTQAGITMGTWFRN
jgi:hypothetical protein